MHYTVKPVLSCHSKINETKILMTNGSLMKVKSIALSCTVRQSAEESPLGFPKTQFPPKVDPSRGQQP